MSQLDLRFSAPVAPGSDTSALAGEELDRAGKARKERRRVLLYFAAQSEPRTRHELAEALYPQTGGIGSACGRVADLMVLGWLAEVGRKDKRSTLAITPSGRQMARLLSRSAA